MSLLIRNAVREGAVPGLDLAGLGAQARTAVRKLLDLSFPPSQRRRTGAKALRRAAVSSIWRAMLPHTRSHRANTDSSAMR